MNNKLSLTPMSHVDNWTGKVRLGLGLRMKLNDGPFSKDTVLFLHDGEFETVCPMQVYTSAFDVERASEKAKQKHIDYHKEQIKYYTEKLKELLNP
jgi:alkyl hydroperoxide reductase subunit AhpC